jgi:hypothetical protein
MKTTLILFREGKSLLCSDEEIKDGWYYNSLDNEIRKNNTTNHPYHHKIIAGIPELPSISMSDKIRQKLEELYGWVDVTWVVEKKFPIHNGLLTYLDKWKGFYEGFNKAQELRGFSLRDMEKAVEMARDISDGKETFTGEDISGCTEVCTYGWKHKYSNQEIIQHLQQPIEIKVELEMEVVRDLDNYGSGDVFHNNMKEQPKITNNSYTIKQLLW